MKITSINIEESLLEKIKKMATKDRRSVSCMISLLLEKAIKH